MIIIFFFFYTKPYFYGTEVLPKLLFHFLFYNFEKILNGTEVFENGTEVGIFFEKLLKKLFACIVIKKFVKKMEQKFCILEQKFGFLKSRKFMQRKLCIDIFYKKSNFKALCCKMKSRKKFEKTLWGF